MAGMPRCGVHLFYPQIPQMHADFKREGPRRAGNRKLKTANFNLLTSDFRHAKSNPEPGTDSTFSISAATCRVLSSLLFTLDA